MQVSNMDIYLRTESGTDWKKIGVVATSLESLDDSVREAASGFRRYGSICARMRCRVVVDRKKMRKIMAVLNPGIRRKTTYRTIRRECAKRNKSR